MSVVQHSMGCLAAVPSPRQRRNASQLLAAGLIAAAAIGATACNDDGGGTSAATTSSAAPAPKLSGEYPCTTLTAAEVESVLGRSGAQPDAEGPTQYGQRNCAWSFDHSAEEPTIEFFVHTYRQSDLTEPAKEQYASVRQIYDKTAASSSSAKRDISGLGEAAYARRGEVNVMAGETYFVVSSASLTDEQLETLARFAVVRV